eukprot:GHVO01053735.1.p1 GENE.GHVO01053735.1~~GHVO01053735.1.p1  ORF type:complete len:140 (+),score=5.72 GHVO01053735.1:459-878(+)
MNTHGASTMDDSDSWVLKSHLTLTRPSWIKDGSQEEEEDEDYFRISIGQFMEKRTQPLGSLDGDERCERVSDLLHSLIFIHCIRLSFREFQISRLQFTKQRCESQFSSSLWYFSPCSSFLLLSLFSIFRSTLHRKGKRG